MDAVHDFRRRAKREPTCPFALVALFPVHKCTNYGERSPPSKKSNRQ